MQIRETLRCTRRPDSDHSKSRLPCLIKRPTTSRSLECNQYACSQRVRDMCVDKRRLVITAVIFTTSLFAPPIASADDYVVSWQGHGDGPVTLRGPRTVVVEANPIRYAWQLRVNERLISGPALDRALTGTSSGQTNTTSGTVTTAVANAATQATGGTGATPQNSGNAAANVDLSSPFQGGQLLLGTLGTSASPVPAGYPCPTNDLNAIRQCVKKLKADADKDVSLAQAANQSLSDLKRVSLMAAITTIDSFLRAHPLGTDVQRKMFDAALSSELLQPDGPIDTFRKEYRSLREYPFPSLASDDQHAGALQQACATLQDQATSIVAAALKRATTPQQTSLDQEDLAKIQRDVVDIQNELAVWDDKSQNAKAYALVHAQFDNLFNGTVNRLQAASFYSLKTEGCADLSDSSKQTTIEIDVGSDSSQVTVECSSRVFVSSGFAFSSLPQRTYSAVVQNQLRGTSPTAAAAPTPAPYAVIVDTNVSQIRPIPSVLANVRLSDAPKPLFGSFGVTLSSSSTASVFDYLGGLSYSLDRTMTLTGGVHLGQVTELASGYQLGDLIAPGSAPQTTTRLKTGFFMGITFGNH
jgi:hypothetical protein